MIKKNEGKVLADGKALAASILEQLDGVWVCKLKELKDDLLKLRDCFHELGGKKPIEGCSTWDAFCQEKLHRTKRAVNLMLADDPKREETSHRKKPKEYTLAEHQAARYEMLCNEVRSFCVKATRLQPGLDPSAETSS